MDIIVRNAFSKAKEDIKKDFQGRAVLSIGHWLLKLDEINIVVIKESHDECNALIHPTELLHQKKNIDVIILSLMIEGTFVKVSGYFQNNNM